MANQQQYGASKWGDYEDFAELRENLLRHLPTWMTDNMENYRYVMMGIRDHSNNRQGAYGRNRPNETTVVVDILSLEDMRLKAAQHAALRHRPVTDFFYRLKY